MPCAGSGSTGTRGRSSRPQRADRHAEALERLLERGSRLPLAPPPRDDVRGLQGAPRRTSAASAASRRTRARSACACPTRARPSSTTSSAGRRAFPARAHGRPRDRPRRRLGALQLRRRGRRPRRRHHARGARRGPPLQHAQAAARVRGAAAPTAPCYAHLPLLHGPDGKKLSKRHGAASVQELRDAGYLPEAVVNYIALLGAGFAADEEHFSLEELAERFRLERVSKNPAVFDEQKLRHMNGRYLRELGLDELTARLEAFTGRDGPARRGRDLGREDPDAGRLLAAGRLPVRRPGRRPGRLRAHDLRRRRVETLGAARDALAAAPSRSRCRDVEAALRGVVERRDTQAGQGLPAGARRDRRNDRLAGDLRERRAARSRGDAGAHRWCACTRDAAACALN